jgi:hypothetical protein
MKKSGPPTTRSRTRGCRWWMRAAAARKSSTRFLRSSRPIQPTTGLPTSRAQLDPDAGPVGRIELGQVDHRGNFQRNVSNQWRHQPMADCRPGRRLHLSVLRPRGRRVPRGRSLDCAGRSSARWADGLSRGCRQGRTPPIVLRSNADSVAGVTRPDRAAPRAFLPGAAPEPGWADHNPIHGADGHPWQRR